MGDGLKDVSGREKPVLLLRPELFGSVDRYVHMARCCPAVVVDIGMPYDKRAKSTHRFTIADTRGPLNVAVPIVHPAVHHGTLVSDIVLSDHSPWWLTAMTALESAYGRTPYFEFYADDFAALFDARRVGTPLVDFCRDADAVVCRLIGLPQPVYRSVGDCRDEEKSAAGVCDMRKGVALIDGFARYYQVREDKLGFLPHLSVVDLLFNLGPEALLYLDGSL